MSYCAHESRLEAIWDVMWMLSIYYCSEMANVTSPIDLLGWREVTSSLQRTLSQKPYTCPRSSVFLLYWFMLFYMYCFACMCLQEECPSCLQRSRGCQISGMDISDGCKPPCRFWESNQDPLQDIQVSNCLVISPVPCFLSTVACVWVCVRSRTRTHTCYAVHSFFQSAM